MKKRKRLPPQKRDRNHEAAYAVGRLARDYGKPVTSCPNLIPDLGEYHATVLMNAWVEGWHARDKELRDGRLAMKGTD
jgi:hypothetical protein